MQEMFYGFDVLISSSVNDVSTRDRVWVSASDEESARLTALATWPGIKEIVFYKAVSCDD